VRASPLARRLAREKGVDLSAISGTGPGGRIVKKDVESAPATPAPMPAFMPAAISQPAAQVPLTRLRAAIARRMTESKQQVPQFYVTHDYGMALLMELRKQINSMLPEEEKVSVNDMIVKAVALTLKRFPNLNASFQGNQVAQHSAVNIGIAVTVEGGLLTVVCRDTDRKSLRQIASEVKAMVARAREGKVRPDDIEGSTFSISNMGMYDVEVFSAIINPPEAGIIAVGTVKDVPVVKDGQLAIGTRMKATISVDHRVSDGVEAARFMQALAEPLEKPLMLML
jgi:pyruvate dehydrogenase E2 component (dihydrolipoyllysine-residue acetyltransferase)